MNIIPARYARLLRHVMRLEDALAQALGYMSAVAPNYLRARATLTHSMSGYFVQDDKAEMDWLDKYEKAERESEAATWESLGRGIIEHAPDEEKGP